MQLSPKPSPNLGEGMIVYALSEHDFCENNPNDPTFSRERMVVKSVFDSGVATFVSSSMKSALGE